MGRKRWWKGSLELLVLCFLYGVVHGDGEVGCLFSKNVCRSGVETCYDDSAFGRCVRPYGVDEESTYRYDDLDSRELELLRRQLEGLVVGGYEWTHPYTQCVMQLSLASLRYRVEREVEICRELADLDERNVDEYGDEVEIEEDPQPLAVVNFTPTRGHGYGDFADEKYYPPVSSKKPKRNINRQLTDIPILGTSFEHFRKPGNQRFAKFEDDNEGDVDDDDFLLQSTGGNVLNLHPNFEEFEKTKHGINRQRNDFPDFGDSYSYHPFRMNNDDQLVAKLEEKNFDDADDRDDDDEDDDLLLESPNKMLNLQLNLDKLRKNVRNLDDLAQRLNPKNFQSADRSKNQFHKEENPLRIFRPSRMNAEYADSAKDILRDSDENDNTRRYRRWKNTKMNDNMWRFIMMNATLQKRYTDNVGKLEFMGNEDKNDENEDEDDGWMNRDTGDEEREALEDNNRENFAREEISPAAESSRGEFFFGDPKNGMYTEGGLVQPLDLHDVMREVPETDDPSIFDDDVRLLWSRDLAAFQRPERLDVKKPGPLFSTNNYAFKTQSPPASPVEEPRNLDREENEILRAPLVKKQISDVIYNGKTYENVDLDHLYIQFNSEFTKWSDGEKVVEEVAKLLGLSPSIFTDIRVGRAEVTFKVTGEVPNDAIGIAEKIDGIAEELRKTTGREITNAGIGDKVKLPPSVKVQHAPPGMSRGLFAGIVSAGAACAAAAAVVTLIIARKHAKSRAKLAGLATPDPEASKDYQDLCRARMQAKQPNEKPESPRIISLSKESESNRSSTSSWGEEAAALTNMDISTGHMVLTYMEDHLKNKDRLDQEWAGICAYEADPSSVAVAADKSNADRNRPGSSLPYDHSRVVLNDLSNAGGSDYINASTITDHDPRNPAYIATQGPLPQTSADFWQLVWEQGSVVIVMLTRLTEEGRGMCHRYWPEEGSELYHFYEVHLVSEHIWCDDYLVRSFYLKNLRTGETRTVTQFHFLSWPENGVPLSTKALLEFRRKVNKSYRGRSCPIVVHCSDGAGRTGTYCLIDMVLNRMAKGAKEIDIAAALEHIRDQRPGMVATKQQFEFVLVAVAEEVHAILKALPVQQVAEKSQSAGNTAGNSQSSEQ